MDILRSLIMAFSLYSKIPMPRVEWREENMKYVMCFFPLIGIVHGLIWIIWFMLASKITAVVFYKVLTLSALPFLLDGGIHFDGFLDVCDALHSYGDKQKKLDILKDPHIGAFAVIYGIIYVLFWVSAVSLADKKNVLFLSFIFCLTRAMSSLMFVTLEGAKKDGMHYTVSTASDNKLVIITSCFYIVACIAVMLRLSMVRTVVVVIVGALTTVYYKHMAYKNFGGVTGDTAGWYLQMLILFMFLSVGLWR